MKINTLSNVAAVFGVMMLFVLGNVSAQTPAYSVGSTTSGSNVIPFGNGTSWNSYRCQFLYVPGDFGAVPSGMAISKIYFVPSNVTATVTFTDFEVSIGQSTITSLSSASWVTGLTPSINVPSYTFSAVTNQWWEITLPTPIPYDPTLSLIIDARKTSSTHSVGLRNQSGTGNRRAYAPHPSATPSGASTTRYTFGFDLVPAGPPCPVITSLSLNNINSTSIAFSWTSPTETEGTEYIIDQNPTGPNSPTGVNATTGASAVVTGLTPSTAYYLHVRNMCDSPRVSQWIDSPFTTLPPCEIPPGLQVPFVDSNSATLVWNAVGTAVEYEYFVKLNRNTPTSSAGAAVAATNQLILSGLQSGKMYYLHLRVKCQGNDSSGWMLDSFYVPFPCRPPNVMFDAMNDTRVVAYWAIPDAAKEYEIINSKAQLTNPVSGIKLANNSYLLPFLDDNTQYYIYARTYCDDRGILGISPWSEASYKTWATSVTGVSAADAILAVHPNPVQQEMVVTVGGLVTDGKIAIMDMTGKVLKSQSINNNIITLDVSELPAGMYIVQYTDDARRQYVKFSKQ